VQATPSNYRRAHHGRATPYIEYFVEPGRAQVLVDVLQSEQGSWFRGKRNRNVVMEVTTEVEHHDDFVWLTLRDLYALMGRPNMVNMDSRTVLSCLPLPAIDAGHGSSFAEGLLRSTAEGDDSALLSSLELGSWLTWRKASYELTTERVPLRGIDGWIQTTDEIRHQTGRFFSIIGVRVNATNREVRSWCQPLLAPHGDGLVAFVVRQIDGVLHILARADVRPGYRDIVELGPTVQCTPANFAGSPGSAPEYLDVVLAPDAVRHLDVSQSEEGGRFARAVTRHTVVEVDDRFPLETHPDYAWITLSQLRELIRASYQVNIEARSLASCLYASTGGQ
jgi:oxidase EvaA